MKMNFGTFVEQARATGRPIVEVEREGDDGVRRPLDAALLDGADTLSVISFDSLRTGQAASAEEAAALRAFLADPDHLAFLCPTTTSATPAASHTMSASPSRRPRSCIMATERSRRSSVSPDSPALLAALGLPVANRFGLRPKAQADGSPAPIEVETAVERLHLLQGVDTFNLHPHLPHFERSCEAEAKMDVLVRQPIDPAAPPHPFAQSGRATFDAVLQSRFAGALVVGDATLWSSTAGGVESLKRFWANVLTRGDRS